jgi:hypothetical protein
MNAAMHKNNTESGASLIVVISVLVVLMVIITVAVTYTNTVSRDVQRSDTLGSAMAIADGCMENLFASWRQVCRSQPNQAPSTNDLANVQLPQQTQFPTVPNFSATGNDYDDTSATTVQQYKVVAADPELTPMPSSSATPIPSVGQQSTVKTFNYIATAFVTLPTGRGATVKNGAVVAKVQRVFQKEQISPWNWAIFFNDPLEIHPGPPFNVTGWVHTNSDLYTAHNTLHFMDKVTYGNSWSIDYEQGDPRKNDGVAADKPTSPTWPSNMPPALDVQHQPFGIDTGSTFSTSDSNPNNDSYRELIEQAVSGYSDPFSPSGQPKERYSDQAGVTISTDASNNITITNQSGTVLTSSSTANDKKLYDMFITSGAISTNYTLQDNRELAQVRVATLDVSKIIDSSGNWKAGSAFNGVLYMVDTSATEMTNPPPSSAPALTHRAFRLKNGSFIPQNGVTIASRNPIYIQGDFNTGTNPPSNSGNAADAATPQASGYTRQPCAVVADAVYVLSDAWTDSWGASGISLGTRTASNTTVNTAIVSGIVPTNAFNNNKYSGGAENFPRFNEDWSNKTLTYYGSMVELFNSQQAIGNWGNSNVYSPPIRQWYFDNNFKTSAPPGTFMLYNYLKGRWSLL